MSYKNNPKVAMFLVYVREIHPARETGEGPPKNPQGPGDIVQHKTMDDRIVAASACAKGLNLTLPVLIDSMDGVAEKAYRGVPAATAIVDLDGNLVFHSEGPNGVQPKEAEKVLRRLLDQPAK